MPGTLGVARGGGCALSSVTLRPSACSGARPPRALVGACTSLCFSYVRDSTYARRNGASAGTPRTEGNRSNRLIAFMI